MRNKMQIYSHLLKKSSIENFIFCVALGKPFETVLETSVLHIHAKILIHFLSYITTIFNEDTPNHF